MLLVLGAYIATSSPSLCASCHEMRPAVAQWSKSPHAEVGCYSCHQTPRPWYALPQTLAERVALLSRDVSRHQSGGYRVSPASNIHAAAITDSTCQQCHDPSRRPTPRYGVVIDHAKHAARNKSCMSCHYWTAHPDPTRDRATAMMARCFTCHGQTTVQAASSTCGVCHLKGVPLRPPSHTTGDWKLLHGKSAKADRQLCSMCHTQAFCLDCHGGLQMPHPAGWVTSKTGHALVGSHNRALCSRCHTSKPDLCSMCHHKEFGYSQGLWVNQHFLVVRKSGAAFCMQCHLVTFCIDCHSTGHGSAPALKPL